MLFRGRRQNRSCQHFLGTQVCLSSSDLNFTVSFERVTHPREGSRSTCVPLHRLVFNMTYIFRHAGSPARPEFCWRLPKFSPEEFGRCRFAGGQICVRCFGEGERDSVTFSHLLWDFTSIFSAPVPPTPPPPPHTHTPSDGGARFTWIASWDWQGLHVAAFSNRLELVLCLLPSHTF